MRRQHLVMLFSTLLGAALMAGGAGCKKDAPPPPVRPGSAEGMPPGASGGAGGAGGSPKARGGLRGRVLETMDAAGYTYLKLRTSNGAVWAAVRKARVTQGQTVVVADPQLMKNFRSRSLKRTFDEIYFGQLAGGDRGAVGRKGGRGHAGPGAGGKSAVEAHRDAKHVRATFAQPVPKAPGAQGRTVAEVYAQRKALAGQPVTVRAKVVKVSRNIMGKNWVHLQDGTAHGKDFDLTVTTQADAKVGDVVLATGTVQADKDLGAGYFYKVLVAGAKLTPAPDARRAPPRARPASPASSADGATAPARRAARASMAPGARSTR